MGTETQCGVVRLGIEAQKWQRIGGQGPEEAIEARESISTVMRTSGQDEGQMISDFHGALAKDLAP